MKSNLQLSKNAKYEWNPSMWSGVSKTDIQKVIKELRAIENSYGEVNPALIIEASKKKNSLLHNYFEWDNEKAADQWRVKQAQYLLNAIQVKVIKEGKPVRMQAYSITKRIGKGHPGESSYTKFDVLSEDNYIYIQRNALTDLLKIKNKLEAYDLSAALPFIEKAIKILQKDELIPITSSK